MAKGADDDYWEEPNLPSTLKHTLLKKYVPRFGGMTGSQSAGKRVVFLDGYAGRGRYANGDPGSAEHIMMIAEDQARAGLRWTCFFVEKEAKSAGILRAVVDEYTARGVEAKTHKGDVAEVLDEVLASADGAPLFLFLDPTGLGLPYREIVRLLTEQRQLKWPPTEVLINFSLWGVRRIGGLVRLGDEHEASRRRLDAAVDGPWWRTLFNQGVTDEAVQAVVSGFTQRLAADTDMQIVTIPVSKGPKRRAEYHLVFGTRDNHGLWVLGDSVARATEAWWDTLESEDEHADPDALFTITAAMRPTLSEVEAEAVPVIATNLARLLQEHAQVGVVEHVREVFGDYYGRVREPVVRQAIKRLFAQGGTSTNGKGGKPHELIVERPS